MGVHKLGIVPKDLNKLQNKELFGLLLIKGAIMKNINGIDFKKVVMLDKNFDQENTTKEALEIKLIG